MTDVYVYQSSDGPQYARVFASPEAFLEAYADYIAEREAEDPGDPIRGEYAWAASAATRSRAPVGIDGEGETLMRVRLESVPE